MERWQASPAGAGLLAKLSADRLDALARSSADLRARTARAVAAWQDHLLHLVHTENITRRSIARVASFDPESLALVLTIGVLGYGAGDVLVSEGASAVPQQLLTSLFGAGLMRDIGGQARQDLRERVGGFTRRRRSGSTAFVDAVGAARRERRRPTSTRPVIPWSPRDECTTPARRQPVRPVVAPESAAVRRPRRSLASRSARSGQDRPAWPRAALASRPLRRPGCPASPAGAGLRRKSPEFRLASAPVTVRPKPGNRPASQPQQAVDLARPGRLRAVGEADGAGQDDPDRLGPKRQGRLQQEAADRGRGGARAGRGADAALVEPTVVVLAGGTGSGKSSLFNRLAGADFSTVGVTRPVTSGRPRLRLGRRQARGRCWTGLAVPRQVPILAGQRARRRRG